MLAGMFANPAPPPPMPSGGDSPETAPRAVFPMGAPMGAPAEQAPPEPPKPVVPSYTFPEPPNPPPAFDKKLKRVYPSKSPNGTCGCSEFHDFITSSTSSSPQREQKASTKDAGGGGGGGGIGKRYIDGEIKRGGYGGGGSSDVRLIEDDVKTRIVAAGGGGISGDIGYSSGGNAGGISSERVLCYNKVDFSDYANQTYGYDLLYGEDGRDGKEYVGTGSEGNGGAGGGYYGGKVTHRHHLHLAL